MYKRVHARTYITVLSTCALRILLNFPLSTVCTSDELESSPFSFSVYSVVCPKHTPDQHFDSLSLALSLSFTLSSLSHSLSHSLSLFLSPFLPLLPDKDCGIDFGKTLCRSFQTVFLFVRLCMAAYNLPLLLSFSAQECPGALPWPDLSSFFLLLIFFSQCTKKSTCSLLYETDFMHYASVSYVYYLKLNHHVIKSNHCWCSLTTL